MRGRSFRGRGFESEVRRRRAVFANRRRALPASGADGAVDGGGGAGWGVPTRRGCRHGVPTRRGCRRRQPRVDVARAVRGPGHAPRRVGALGKRDGTRRAAQTSTGAGRGIRCRLGEGIGCRLFVPVPVPRASLPGTVRRHRRRARSRGGRLRLSGDGEGRAEVAARRARGAPGGRGQDGHRGCALRPGQKRRRRRRKGRVRSGRLRREHAGGVSESRGVAVARRAARVCAKPAMQTGGFVP